MDAAWMAARTRNALRRPILIWSVCAPVFIGALMALVIVPRQANRRARVAAPPTGERTDTMPLIAEADRLRRAIASADSALSSVRTAVLAATAPPQDTFPAHLRARRDSLAIISGRLSGLLARAENAPLLASYRALGESPELRNESRVHALLDTLVEIEREREAFGPVAGVDPVFIELTARATTIGREIEAIARQRRAAVRRELLALRPAQPPPPVIPIVDTTALFAERDSIATALASAERFLAVVRQRNREVEAQAERVRDLANVTAPPVAILAAALVIGSTLGFVLVLLMEVRRPRVADAREAERVTGHRVICIVTTVKPAPERMRRRSDKALPPLVDITSESYRQLHLHLAPIGSSVSTIAVTGDEPGVIATVSTNLAAAATNEMRNTLLIDADVATGAVAGVLHINPDPGIAGIAADIADWASAMIITTLGRSRTLDVIPGGEDIPGTPMTAVRDALVRDLERLARRYDLVVIASPPVPSAAAALPPVADMVLCARAGHSPLAGLEEAVKVLERARVRLHGIVLWDTLPPQIPSRDEMMAARTPSVGTARDAREESLV